MDMGSSTWIVVWCLLDGELPDGAIRFPVTDTGSSDLSCLMSHPSEVWFPFLGGGCVL